MSQVNLSQLQNTLEQSTQQLKTAQASKLRADQEYEAALAQHEKARVELNKGVFSLTQSTVVPNLYAA